MKIYFLLFCVVAVSALKREDCDVCFNVLDTFRATLTKDQLKSTAKIEHVFRQYCNGTKGKDNRFCYFVGGLKESATSVLGELSKPLSWSLPTHKICEKLKKKDSQLCDLRYEKIIDLKSVYLKNLKVRDLKKILSDWDEDCEDCLEKGDFIRKIEDVKPKHLK
ncbi:mesencephalic astrocyte-derived neurotrophic factor homolog [Artemia franciscana]